MSDDRVWTIGHSTREANELLELLQDNEIRMLVDVRSYPSSRRLPQFNQEQLSSFLELNQINYRHLRSLGGRRRPNPHSKNLAWRNESFRAYADYMETAEFRKGVEELLELVAEQRTAIMCAEALWWRCHRSLISDYLKSIGVEVVHILAKRKTELHPYTAAATIVDGNLSYEGLIRE